MRHAEREEHFQFERANEIRIQHGATVFRNPRNGTSGTLRAKVCRSKSHQRWWQR
ncbi:hypothetical protein GCM10020367_58450 [Streptomyces sannanensis]|uniref:Uncharacterized protein n=1 Tax=Streptomyces sannanensis TaxID=285536 RepID=A0ABP6SK94_9ACTN